MKKILIFSLAYHPFVGGAEIAIKEITDRIPRSSIEFDLVTLRFDSRLPRKETIGNVTVYRIGFSKRDPKPNELMVFPLYLNKVLYPVLACLKALSLHRRRKYDALWAMMTYMGLPALFFSWFKRVPIILTLQDGDTVSHITRRMRIRPFYFLLRRVFKKVALVQVISTYLAKFARDMGYKGEIAVVPNGVDTSLFSRDYNEQELGALRWQFHKEPDDVFLVTTSRFVEKNGIADVIRALPLLPDHIKFLIIGFGPLEAELKELTAQLRLEQRVIFAGIIENKEVPKYLKISNIFIRPSLSEGMGISFIEAMAAGIPVITTNVGGIPDFLKENETGIFCKVNDPESIAHAVHRLLDNAPLREKIVAHAKKLAAERYDWKRIIAEMESGVFDKI